MPCFVDRQASAQAAEEDKLRRAEELAKLYACLVENKGRKKDARKLVRKDHELQFNNSY